MNVILSTALMLAAISLKRPPDAHSSTHLNMLKNHDLAGQAQCRLTDDFEHETAPARRFSCSNGGERRMGRWIRLLRQSELENAKLPARIMVDFSHANSNKQHKKQLDVGRNVASQIAGGESRIFGVMIESHLKEGTQKVVPGKELIYGQSITDACLGWEDSEELIRDLAVAVNRRRSCRMSTL